MHTQNETQFFSTSQIAREVDVHPNTVRLYEKWGYLPEIPRKSNGYRVYTQTHIEQMKLSRLCMQMTWLGGKIRRLILDIVFSGAEGKINEALDKAIILKEKIIQEKQHALKAVNVLQDWMVKAHLDDSKKRFRIGKVAKVLEISIDQMRNWEKNGLIVVPRNPENKYRIYGEQEIARLRIIRTLLKARYSTMSVLKLLTKLDNDTTEDPLTILYEMLPEEDIYYATDQWLLSLEKLQETSERIIQQLEKMVEMTK